MYRLLTVVKIIAYAMVLFRVFEKPPMNLPLVLLAVALVVSGFWRNFYDYQNHRVNALTLHLDLVFTFLFSQYSHNGSFDKFFLVYLIEGIIVLPRPYFFAYVVLTLIASAGATALFDIRTTGQLEMPQFAQVLLMGLIIVLVLSERRQREQKLAYKKLAEELEYVNLQLRESIAWSEKFAHESERRRIAGEIHDSLGHDLTGLILTLEAGKRLTDVDGEAGKAYWDKGLQVARKAINSVRELVSESKGAGFEFDLDKRLEDLARGVRDLTGLKVDLEVSGGDMGLSAKEQFSIFRVLQEAITNTLRHAGADHAKISITDDQGRLSLSYWDNGRGTDQINEGNGLKGMIGRVAGIGGIINFHSDIGSGFRINVYLDRKGNSL